MVLGPNLVPKAYVYFSYSVFTDYTDSAKGNAAYRNAAKLVRQPNAIFPPNPQISDIFFSLLIIHPWGVYNEIWGGVEVSPLSNFKYSRWRPRWLPRREFLLFRCFSATDQPCFGQYACFGFNGWNRKGLRRIVSTVDMVTSNTANVSR